MSLRSILFLLLLVPALANAQPREGQARLDSLLAAARSLHDTSGVRLLNIISHEYVQRDPDMAVAYAQRMLALARKIGWEKGEAGALNWIGQLYSERAEYPKALDYLFRALPLYEAQNNKRGIASVYLNIGHVYWGESNSDKALDYHLKALKMSTELNDSGMTQVEMVHVGGDYVLKQDYEKALQYYRNSLTIAEATGNKSAIAAGYANLGDMYVVTRHYPEALAYKFKGLRGARDIGNKRNEANIKAGIGLIYLYISQDSTGLRPDSLIAPGRKANMALAERYLREGIGEAQAQHYDNIIPQYATALSAIYEDRGNYRQALKYYQLASAVHDSIFSGEKSASIAALETKRAIELKEKDVQIARLAVEKKRVLTGLLMAGIALLLTMIAFLLRSFRRQRRSNILLSREKKRSDDLLLNILPAEVAEELKEKGAASARQYDSVSVLFTDFADFTGTAEKLDPQALVRALHECFTAFDAIIDKHGLEKIKTIGDAYMAVCGLPGEHPRHAQACVAAAAEIRDFVGMRMTARAAEGASFRIRIGINSGPVVAGIVGVKKFAYDIWGDTVNTAARMEQHGEAGAINISQSTYELVKHDYRCIYRGNIAAKNKGEIAMYFVAGSVEA